MSKKRIRVKLGTEVRVAQYPYDGGDYLLYSCPIYVYPLSSIVSLIETLTEMKNKYGNNYSDIQIEEIHDCGCRYDCHCSPSHILTGIRDENDLEYNFRIEKDKKIKEAQRANDLAQYEALKKKLEK